MMEKQNRGYWFLLTGLILGIAAGLLISLLLAPSINPEALPHELSGEARSAYRLMIAQAYGGVPDLARAQSRLQLVGDASPADALIAQAQTLLAQGGSETDARTLVQLATALQAASPGGPQ
jgi:hypothetical protein